MYSEELGICRFHRCWSERASETLLRRGRGIDLNLDEHCRELLRKIIGYDREANQYPVFWETKKTMNVIRAYLSEVSRKLPAEPHLNRWVERFTEEPEEAAREYWEEARKGYEEIIEG